MKDVRFGVGGAVVVVVDLETDKKVGGDLSEQCLSDHFSQQIQKVRVAKKLLECERPLHCLRFEKKFDNFNHIRNDRKHCIS